MSERLYIGTGDEVALCDLIHVNGGIAYVECDYKSVYCLRAYFCCPKGIGNGTQFYTLGGTYYDGTYYYPLHRVTFTSTTATTGYSYDLSAYYIVAHYIGADNTTTTFAGFSSDMSYSIYSLTLV